MRSRSLLLESFFPKLTRSMNTTRFREGNRPSLSRDTIFRVQPFSRSQDLADGMLKKGRANAGIKHVALSQSRRSGADATPLPVPVRDRPHLVAELGGQISDNPHGFLFGQVGMGNSKEASWRVTLNVSNVS